MLTLSLRYLNGTKKISNCNFSSRGFDVLLLYIYVRRGIRTSYVVVMAVCVFMKSNSVVT